MKAAGGPVLAALVLGHSPASLAHAEHPTTPMECPLREAESRRARRLPGEGIQSFPGVALTQGSHVRNGWQVLSPGAGLAASALAHTAAKFQKLAVIGCRHVEALSVLRKTLRTEPVA